MTDLYYRAEDAKQMIDRRIDSGKLSYEDKQFFIGLHWLITDQQRKITDQEREIDDLGEV